MSVSAISGTSSLSYWNQSTGSASSSKTSATSDTFSELLSQITGTSGTSSSSSGDAEDTVTVTKVLPDGSLVVMKMQGSKVISETKLSGASVQEQQNMLTTANKFMQAYSAGDAISAGSLFSASI
jgi:hypothetical protein